MPVACQSRAVTEPQREEALPYAHVGPFLQKNSLKVYAGVVLPRKAAGSPQEKRKNETTRRTAGRFKRNEKKKKEKEEKERSK